MKDGKNNWLKIDHDVYAVLKQVSESKNRPQTEYIERGLRVVLGLEKIPQMSLIVLPILYFFIGVFLFIFTLLFINQLPSQFYIIQVAMTSFIILMSFLIYFYGNKLWKVKNGT